MSVVCQDVEVLRTQGVPGPKPVWNESIEIIVSRLFGSWLRFVLMDGSDDVGEVTVNLGTRFTESNDAPVMAFKVAGGPRGDGVLNIRITFQPTHEPKFMQQLSRAALFGDSKWCLT